MDYKVQGNFYPTLAVTVKGDIADLAVLMTTPDGKVSSKIIKKEQMTANVATVEFYPEFQEGEYTLAVKRIQPEKTLLTKKVNFVLGNLAIKDFDVKVKKASIWPSTTSNGFVIEEVNVSVAKDGDLPVAFVAAAIGVNGDTQVISHKSCVVSKTGQVKIEGIYPPIKFVPGKRTIRVALKYSEKQLIKLEKEFVFPESDL